MREKELASNYRPISIVTSALSDWASVISGVPMGVFLVPLFINDWPRDILGKLFLFGDDRKLLQVLFSAVYYQELKSDIDLLIEWSDKLQLKFNTSKCKVMHIGPTNTR